MAIDHSIEITQQQKNMISELLRDAVKNLQEVLDTVEKDLREHNKFTIGVVNGFGRATVILGSSLDGAKEEYISYFQAG